MPSPKPQRLTLRCGGDPTAVTIALNGEPVTFVSRFELVLEVSGQRGMGLVVPAQIIEVDSDTVEFVATLVPPAGSSTE